VSSYDVILWVLRIFVNEMSLSEVTSKTGKAKRQNTLRGLGSQSTDEMPDEVPPRACWH